MEFSEELKLDVYIQSTILLSYALEEAPRDLYI